MDKEVLREIWHGQLPLCFKLHQDDIGGMHNPEPYYMMVPRVTYFPLVLDRVIKYFNRFIDQNKQDINELWLDYDGQPIKWQHPIGLSWDLLGSSFNLPWTLVLHFSDFPAKELVRCNTKASIRTNFMYSLKEADVMKHKGAVIMNIVEKDLNQLWSSLQNDKFDQFWRINQRLMERTDNKLFKNIPYRMYFPDYTYLQKSVRPSEEQEITMLDLIEITFMDRMDDLLFVRRELGTREQLEQFDNKLTLSDELEQERSEESESVKQEDGEEAGGGSNENETESQINNPKELLESPRRTGKDNRKKLIDDVGQFKYKFVTHGIEIPLDAPLQWLSEHLSYPDNFLHIVALPRQPDDL